MQEDAALAPEDAPLAAFLDACVALIESPLVQHGGLQLHQRLVLDAALQNVLLATRIETDEVGEAMGDATPNVALSARSEQPAGMYTTVGDNTRLLQQQSSGKFPPSFAAVPESGSQWQQQQQQQQVLPPRPPGPFQIPQGTPPSSAPATLKRINEVVQEDDFVSCFMSFSPDEGQIEQHSEHGSEPSELRPRASVRPAPAEYDPGVEPPRRKQRKTSSASASSQAAPAGTTRKLTIDIDPRSQNASTGSTAGTNECLPASATSNSPQQASPASASSAANSPVAAAVADDTFMQFQAFEGDVSRLRYSLNGRFFPGPSVRNASAPAIIGVALVDRRGKPVCAAALRVKSLKTGLSRNLSFNLEMSDHVVLRQGTWCVLLSVQPENEEKAHASSFPGRGRRKFGIAHRKYERRNTSFAAVECGALYSFKASVPDDFLGDANELELAITTMSGAGAFFVPE